MTFIEYQSKLSLNPRVGRVGELHQVRVILADSTPTISKKKKKKIVVTQDLLLKSRSGINY